ncbi:MAG TPA: hypothetical protein VJS38_19970 [Phenylobacterium sp.]|uniref:hypothetical protein n=1 Tax=Phenylobacterium sp. TaxID=1871053 RepID=UPI002B4A91E6|nr:hypothetical protein [Phenylobacterium sp.]HKR90453.1 hypothetical protein [Phenylobacterium sp.]
MQTTGPAIAGAFAAALVATGAQAASLDLSKQIDARGAKPPWSLTVTNGTDFKLTRPGKPALAAKAPGSQIGAGGVSWTAKAADGQTMKVSFQNTACSVGSAKYPMTAQVEIGGETLSGCAGYK